jgi:CBS domain-containing protein
LTKVSKVMSTDLPKIDSSATILEASNLMNSKDSTGVVVVEGERVVGLITERGLLWKFMFLNKKPDEVRVRDIMFPFFRIGPDDSTKTAAQKMVSNGITRLGVFDHEKFLGWVTLTDVAREFSKPRLIEALMSPDTQGEKQLLCLRCRRAFLDQIKNTRGEVLRWECPNCHYAL